MKPHSKDQLSHRVHFYNSGTFSSPHFLRSSSLAVYRFVCLLAALVIVLSSCAPPPTSAPAPTAVRPQPTGTEPAATQSGPSLFRIGQRYSDTANDMEVSFLDVISIEANVDDESESLEVTLQMRDIPPTASLEQTTDLIQYAWVIFVYLDPGRSNLTEKPGDYYFAVNTYTHSLSDLATPGIPTPTPSGPSFVPINELLESQSVMDADGMPKAALYAEVDPDQDLLTLIGEVPGITANAVFSFITSYFDGATDEPDNLILHEGTTPATPLAEATQVPAPPLANTDETQLIPAGTVHAYPGPKHFEGDILSFEIRNNRSIPDAEERAQLRLDNAAPFEVSGKWSYNNVLLLPLALDTTGLTGRHTLHISTKNGLIDETYAFEVAPADERPANEENFSWLVTETGCCQFHYISNTAAARDIDFITEQFQQASEQVASITGGSLKAKLKVHLIDRIWGNGGFAGADGLVISYTDRYYGPTIEEKGLENLARHELTHVTNLPGLTGDGVFFSAEGIAVYVAGGHYKPEPLAERGAALYDLGYYVPVGEWKSIDQHELSYLYTAAVLAYIAETYGSEKLWEFLTTDPHPGDGQPAPLASGIQTAFGIPMEQFDRNFQAWLAGKDPGEQLDDLRLTVQLQELRRKYQNTYAPPPDIIAGGEADTVARTEFLPVLIREADMPANVATELLIADAQRAIVDGDYTQAEVLIQILDEVIGTGRLEDPLAKNYLDIVLRLEDAGYDVLALGLQRNQATAQVTRQPPVVTTVKLQKQNGVWQIAP